MFLSDLASIARMLAKRPYSVSLYTLKPIYTNPEVLVTRYIRSVVKKGNNVYYPELHKWFHWQNHKDYGWDEAHAKLMDIARREDPRGYALLSPERRKPPPVPDIAKMFVKVGGREVSYDEYARRRKK